MFFYKVHGNKTYDSIHKLLYAANGQDRDGFLKNLIECEHNLRLVREDYCNAQNKIIPAFNCFEKDTGLRVCAHRKNGQSYNFLDHAFSYTFIKDKIIKAQKRVSFNGSAKLLDAECLTKFSDSYYSSGMAAFSDIHEAVRPRNLAEVRENAYLAYKNQDH